MPNEPNHLDKLGRPLARGDRVEIVYGGTFHEALVTGLTRNLDVDHVELQIATPTTLPSGSVRLLEKAPPAPRSPTPDPEPKPAAHRPAHRPARTTRRT